MYEQLLKFEALELSRKPSISWERIMQIRHLKDRMIRKCQRLSRTSYPRKLSKGDPLTFQTIMAPADFRVKEMEKWFREQQLRTSLVRRQAEPVRSISLNGHSNKTALLPASEFGQLPPSGRCRALPSSSKQPIAVSQTWSDSHPKLIPPPAMQEPRMEQYQQPDHQAPAPSTKAPSVLSIPSHAISSPPALPILLRSQRSALLELEFSRQSDAAALDQPRPSSSEPSLPNASLVAVHGSISPASSSQESIALSEPDATAEPTERRLTHRRSCIKRSSVGAKTVSWADDAELENQLSKYAEAAKDVQLPGQLFFCYPIIFLKTFFLIGRKWEEIREIYLEQVTGLDTLHDQVVQSLDNLRIESEHLERVEKAIVQQREVLRATFLNLEQKQSLLQSKGALYDLHTYEPRFIPTRAVQEALQEADHVLSIAGIIKRDG